MLIGADVGVLHHVFRFVLVAQNRSHGAVQALVIAAHDQLVERSFAREHAGDDCFVAPRFSLCLIENRVPSHHYEWSPPSRLGYRDFDALRMAL